MWLAKRGDSSIELFPNVERCNVGVSIEGLTRSVARKRLDLEVLESRQAQLGYVVMPE